MIRQKWDWNDFLFTSMCIDQQLKRGHVFPMKLIVTIDQMFPSVSRVMFTNVICQSVCIYLRRHSFHVGEKYSSHNQNKRFFHSRIIAQVLILQFFYWYPEGNVFFCHSRNASANFSAIYLQFEIRARGSQVGDEIYMQIVSSSSSTYRNE